VLVDANQLELALLNLALNARDAMPAGGKLTISASAQTNAAADSSLPRGDYLRIKIVDTGVGMDEATRRKAIEPFFTTKRTSKETGLGLSVVHGIAAQSGGLLRIESALNVGTTIELWLPQSKRRPLVAARKVGAITARNGAHIQ
jgi:signal transduction histidine kinase